MPTGIFGKPLRAIYRFSHQNAQPPPSPLVGAGAAGMRGTGASGTSPSSFAPLWEKGAAHRCIRMPNLPLLPLWEKGVGGMRGQRSSSAPYDARRNSDPVTTPAVCISSDARVESRTIVAHGSSGYAWMTCPSAVISSAACTIPSAAPSP